MSKKSKIQAVKGMKDILPSDSHLWLMVESMCADIFSRRGYRQIRTPMLESTHLFARSIGAETDIVSKEMYTFEDRNGDSLTLRPEGTASCVRAGIENGLFYNQQQRLWYTGPMFRHERPQKGRYRQFYQVGVESYGWSTPDIEAEVLAMVEQLFSELGLTNTTLYINSLGDAASRASYRDALVDYLNEYKDQLDEDSVRRLGSNPLRILDSKNEKVQSLLDNAPVILDYLSDESKLHFATLQDYLTTLGIEFEINPKLVRGLDYYNDTVFEWINHDYGAQSTVCGGGRYDSMVEQMGGQDTPAFGFGMGLERLIEMLQEQNASSLEISQSCEVFIVSVGDKARLQAIKLQDVLTKQGLSVQCHMGAGSMKNQFKKADKSLALIGLVIGDAEAQSNQVNVKVLRKELAQKTDMEQQRSVSQDDVVNVVTNLLDSL
ncbi:histidine--tRNA ligase [Arenicella sp. 4NH20-0111]|uniref:histidine--tRNA ligase n=1 Tax=Arenicella sp. 4NH20-0111 TaxID=3127648 RepID=UPI003109EDA6